MAIGKVGFNLMVYVVVDEIRSRRAGDVIFLRLEIRRLSDY